MLTTDTARAIVAAAEARANDLGVPVNIAVVDAGAHLKAFVRMDGAVLGSIDVALGKARTAALFETTSAAVGDYLAAAPNLEASNGGLMPFAGGVFFRRADGSAGAVGVSGGAVPQDRAIAEAAAAAAAG